MTIQFPEFDLSPVYTPPQAEGLVQPRPMHVLVSNMKEGPTIKENPIVHVIHISHQRIVEDYKYYESIPQDTRHVTSNESAEKYSALEERIKVV